VINDNLDVCYEKILKIIKSEKKGIKLNQNSTEIKSKIKELTK